MPFYSHQKKSKRNGLQEHECHLTVVRRNRNWRTPFKNVCMTVVLTMCRHHQHLTVIKKKTKTYLSKNVHPWHIFSSGYERSFWQFSEEIEKARFARCVNSTLHKTTMIYGHQHHLTVVKRRKKDMASKKVFIWHIASLALNIIWQSSEEVEKALLARSIKLQPKLSHPKIHSSTSSTVAVIDWQCSFC